VAISLATLGVNVDRLYHGQPTTTDVSVYTSPGYPGSPGKRTQVSRAVICNPSPSALTVRLSLIPQGGSIDGTHLLLGDQVIPGNTTLDFDLSTIMRAGDQLAAQSQSLPGPTGLSATGSTTGGTLAAATYYYKLTGVNANGETVASAEVSVGTSGATSSVALAWSRQLGVTSYKLYRSTSSNTEALLATISGGATTSYTDTGTATSGGSVPLVGSASGCVFTISGAELPA
jgi:hypothetical protein